MMYRVHSVLFTIMMFFSISAFAECMYNGSKFSEGSYVNGYKCVNGKWEDQ